MLLGVLSASVSCARLAPQAKPAAPVLVIPDVPEAPPGPVYNTPTPNVDIIRIPPSVDADVKVCVEDFPLPEQACITIGELRAFALMRRQASRSLATTGTERLNIQ